MPESTIGILAFFIAIMVTMGVVLLAVVAVILWKLHMPIKVAAAALSSISYAIFPFDFFPEVPFGPIGLVDDVLILVAAASYVGRAVAKRRQGVAPGSGSRALR